MASYILFCIYLTAIVGSITRFPELMNDPDLTALTQKIDYLVALCQKLKEENRLLRSKEQSWLAERAQLMEKNDVARTKVEAMITRLRTLEQES